MRYGYDYFCGANVLVEVAGVTILECAGISYSINETKMPIYGYSSRHFDAVARGRVIVQGSLLLNYVDHDYFWRAIQVGFDQANETLLGLDAVSQEAEDPSLRSIVTSAGTRSQAAALVARDYPQNVALAEAFKRAYWGRAANAALPDISRVTFNPHDLANEVDIKVTFGDRDENSNEFGATGCLLNSVYFTGRGTSIQISEDVIVEEIPFIARDIHSFVGRYDIKPKIQEFFTEESE